MKSDEKRLRESNEILSSKHKTKSQSIRKLNPTNSPRIPPQSATRDWKGKARCSRWTRTFSLPKMKVTRVKLSRSTCIALPDSYKQFQ